MDKSYGYLSFGTLWWVHESLWREEVEGYNLRTSVDEHPAVLTLRMPPLSRAPERVPMLQGRSKAESANCFYACGLSSQYSSDYRTHFGHLAPVPLPTHEIGIAAEPSTPTEGPDAFDLDRWFSERKRIRANFYKPQLTKPEKDRLVAWLSNP